MRFEPSRWNEVNEAFHILFEAAPVGIVAVDGCGDITLLNKQIELMFGYTRDELVGQPVELLVPQRFRCTHAERRKSFSVASASRMRPMGRDVNLFAVRKNGSEFPAEVGLNPVSTGNGALIIATVVDVTLRKQAEERQRLLECERATLATCQQLGMPAAVLQRDGRVLFLNPLMAKLRTQLALTGEQFELANATEKCRFLQALASLEADTADQQLHSIAVHTADDHAPLIFHLLAVKSPLADAFAILIVTTVASAGAPSVDLVQGLFALAPAEARVAALIGSGLAPRQVAKQLGVSEGNVRTALKRVFEKVGVSRQSELVAILAKLSLH
jgi:PAS domain S-box-containing protein